MTSQQLGFVLLLWRATDERDAFRLARPGVPWFYTTSSTRAFEPVSTEEKKGEAGEKILDAPKPEANADSQARHHQVAEAQDDNQPGGRNTQKEREAAFAYQRHPQEHVKSSRWLAL